MQKGLSFQILTFKCRNFKSKNSELKIHFLDGAQGESCISHSLYPTQNTQPLSSIYINYK